MTFNAKTIATALTMLCLAQTAATHTAHAQSVTPTVYPLPTAAVLQALDDAGLSSEGAELQLPTALTARAQTPELEVVSMERVAQGHMRVRLRCKRAGECVSFYATVDHTGVFLVKRAASPAGSSEPQGARAAVEADRPHVLAVAIRPAAAVRTGHPLTMWVQDGHLRIHVPVVALQDAALGAELTVATPDHARKFHAVVIDPDTVQGDAQ